MYSVWPSCVSVHHVCAIPVEARERMVSDSLDVEFQTIVNCEKDARHETWVLQQSSEWPSLLNHLSSSYLASFCILSLLSNCTLSGSTFKLFPPKLKGFKSFPLAFCSQILLKVWLTIASIPCATVQMLCCLETPR